MNKVFATELLELFRLFMNQYNYSEQPPTLADFIIWLEGNLSK